MFQFIYLSIYQCVVLFLFSAGVYYCRNNSEFEDRIEICNLICEVSETFLSSLSIFLVHFRPI